LIGACESGNFEIIDLMIEKGATELDEGLIGSCENGNLKVIEYILSKGAKNLNESLNYCSYSGNEKLAKFFILKGADNLTESMIGAFHSQNLDLIIHLLEKGATNFESLFKKSLENESGKKILLQFLGNPLLFIKLLKLIEKNFDLIQFLKEDQSIQSNLFFEKLKSQLKSENEEHQLLLSKLQN
jgi:ankyrin repeat protein